MTDRKRMGCCTVCDAPCFEVMSRHTEGPFKGEARQLGPPLSGARRVYIVRMSGNHSTWTICKECLVLPEEMPLLHQKELAAMVLERNLATDTMKQAEWREKMLRLLQWDAPLGVLGEKPWTEAI